MEPTAAAAAPAAGSQEAVNAAPSYDSAADSILEMGSADAGAAVSGTDAGSGNAAEVKTPVEVKTGAETTDAAAAPAKPGDQKSEAGQPAADEWAIDQAALNLALADPTHGAIVKALNERYQKMGAFREFLPTVADVHAARELVPGGLQELKDVVERARSAQSENADFMSGDPARQLAALTPLAQENPQAFAAAAPSYLRTLNEVAPAEYTKIGRELAIGALKADGLDQTLATFFQAIAAEDEKGFTAGLQNLQKFAESAGFLAPGGKPAAAATTAKVDPELAKAQARVRELEGAQHQETVQRFETWRTATNDKIVSAAKDDIKSRVDAVLPKNVPTAMRDDLMTRLTDAIFDEVNLAVGKDLDLGQKVAAVIANQAWTKEADKTREQVINLTVGRAKQMIPVVAKRHVDRYTEQTVATTNALTERREEAGKRTDVTGGAGHAHGPRKMSLKEAKQATAGKTEEEILDMDDLSVGARA
jgi:hypothetical protein